MGVTGAFKNFVFPSLRLLVWALIALALLWLAFGRGGPDEADAGTVPSAVVEAPPTPVVRGDVVNTVSLQGSVVADPATTVKSTAAGQVGRLRAAVGDAVEKGDPLFTVVVPVEEPAATSTDPTAAPTAPTTPRTRTVTVSATTTGTLTSLDVLPQQEVTVGQEVAKTSPGTLSVTAPLTQEQQYRLLQPPSSAQVTVPGGPGTFDCTDLTTGRPDDADTTAPADPSGYADPYADPAQATTGTEVTCRVPGGTQVFAGLTATVDVTAGSSTGVLLVPVTAVQGRVGDGTVWVVDPATGEQTETQVELGLTDGTNVEVRSGVEEGTQVLPFVPGSDEVTDPYASGGTVYYG